jgi:opacity protein-like surface antigen
MKRFLFLAIPFWAVSALAQDTNSSSSSFKAETSPALPAIVQPPAFLPTNWNIGFTFGAGFGVKALGSAQAHGLADASVHVGKLLASDSPTQWPPLRHLELAGELWTGAQYHPDTAYVAGFTPVLRYHFLRGARLSPFADAGAGLTATDIGHPDLSTTFEFNLQAGGGIQWFLQDNVALTLQARYVHLSNAGMDSPNDGVNTFVFSGGLSWFF